MGSDEIPGTVKVRGVRRSTLACTMRIVTAMLVLRKLTVKQVCLKADVSGDAARRILIGMIDEGLVRREPDIDNPKLYHYIWIGKE